LIKRPSPGRVPAAAVAVGPAYDGHRRPGVGDLPGTNGAPVPSALHKSACEEFGAEMTYPPQQPGQPGQPGQFGQSSYQGLGSYSGGGQPGPGGPGGRNTGKVVAIVVIALLVLGGGGVATYFLTRDSGGSGADTSSDRTNRDESKDTRSDDSPSDDASSDRDQDQGADEEDASNTPEDVRDDYMAAYENKDFADVVDSACRAYKTKFGTDTSELETKLEDYDISAAPDGEAEIDSEHPDTATAKIDLTLVGDGQTQEPKILIKIVQESGQWRFCGEGTA
jgi:hypothetical protein